VIRAGVFVGVDQTGGLQRLNDAAKGAERMHAWALAQGMKDKTHAKLITDAGGAKVTPDQIFEAIAEIINGPGADQLILYFAGHGVNINRSEQWLLSEAPVKTGAAVNVSGSVELARYCGIQHVVVISDACRVAAEGIQAQNVRGQDVFPNDGIGDRSKPVDQFFACFLGKTAAELKDPKVAAANFSALYTNAMLDALGGLEPALLEAGDDTARYVLPRRLETFLENEIPRRVAELELQKLVNQNPDAIITSDKQWLSRLDQPPPVPPPAAQPTPPPPPVGAGGGLHLPSRGGLLPRPQPPPSPTRSPAPSLNRVMRNLVRSAAGGSQAELTDQLHRTRTIKAPGAAELADATERIVVPFGPDHFETRCGIKVRGTKLIEAVAVRAGIDQISPDGEVVRVLGLEPPTASVLLVFEGGIGTVVPVFNEFIVALTVADGELVDVGYEPSANSGRWPLYQGSSADVRALRAVASAASQHGRFRLDPDDAETVAQKMQYAKGIDPTLAVYAAYAYHDLQALQRIRDMSGYLRADIGATFFDLELLGGALVDKRLRPDEPIVPFFPLLSQGWSLLSAHRVQLHPALKEIERTMLDSLWTLFDANGVEQLRKALLTKEVR
jgi:hypothetical protein